VSYYLTVAAIVKNEARYIEEWICWHLIHGVEHFFIYENDSTDDTYKILKRYEAKGVVTLNRLHGTAQQFPMIEAALRDYGNLTRWMAVIDCDEFLLAESPLPQFLKEFENFSALAVHWQLYGSKSIDPFRWGSVIDRFRWRGVEPSRHVKSIIQPARTISRGKDPHSFMLKTPAVNENKVALPTHYAIKSPPSAERIRINHYHVKSYDEYFIRKSMPRVSTGTMLKDIQESFRHHDKNEVYDPVAVKYLDLLKVKIKEYK